MTAAAHRSETAKKVITALRQGYADADWRAFKLNEADTRSLLISPVLEALGYGARFRKSEDGSSGNRPDECLFVEPVTTKQMPVAVFVEAKPLGANFDASMERGRADSPTRQIQRYLVQHPASDLNSMGILTDGFRWRIYERVSKTDNRLVADLNLRRIGHMHSRLLSDDADPTIQQLNALADLVSRASFDDAKPDPSEPIRSTIGIEFARRFIEDPRPSSVLEALLDESGLVASSDLMEDAVIQGMARDLHDNDWLMYSYVVIPAPVDKLEQAESIGFEKGGSLTVAAVRFTHGKLGRSDVALAARTFAKSNPDNAAVVFAYTATRRGTDLQLEGRLAGHANGHVNMTAAFDPAIPLPSAIAAADRLLPSIRKSYEHGLNARDLLDPLAVSSLRHSFYALVADWVARQQQGQDLRYRQAVLQHLIRLMFTWILKEAGQVPVQFFEEAFAKDVLDDPDRYHSEVLSFLFHERLSVPRDQRTKHQLQRVHDAAAGAPYLNGSLFYRNQDLDGLIELSAEDYWGTNTEGVGIFTILSRYHWTLDEHRPGISEQTLDPELLSNLFERLIAPTDIGPENLDRMPGGTYYTPADVADEMVKDALTAATREFAPKYITDEALQSLYDPNAANFEFQNEADVGKLASRIASLKIFDPAVGSGEFLFSSLVAIKSALKKLNAYVSTEEIVKNQLSGQDIHPLAVQIARLRLFVAIRSSRTVRPIRHSGPTDPDAPTDYPLPNLEARIVCADSLETVADHQWRPDHPCQFDSADPALRAALIELACNRERWFYAHSEAEKQLVMDADDKNRKALRNLLTDKGGLATKELLSFADAEIFSNSTVPAQTDARLLFYESDWTGFDIVIGNPPYEVPYLQLDSPETREKHREAIRRLADEKHYHTTNVRDMFSMFCELGLALANPEHGVLTMIMPMSAAFGRREETLRDRVAQWSASVRLRHYDQRPDAIFNESPTVSSPGNSQRATIMTAIRGSSRARVWTTGLKRWPSSERDECLRAKEGVDVSDTLDRIGESQVSRQWPRIPTNAVIDLVSAVLDQSTRALGNELCEGSGLGLPKSCRYFMSALPVGIVQPRRETVINLPSRRDLLLTLAAMNGHVGYAWWTIFGDGLDVKKSDFDGFAIPDAWIADPKDAMKLGGELIDAADECTVTNRVQGKDWLNVDFHSGRPDLVEQIDKLYISALGLPEEPLLTHLRIMRSNSSWRFPN